jgi:Tol biopolymer transport system component
VIRALVTGLAAAGVSTSVALGSAGSARQQIVFSADRAPALSGEIYRVDLDGHRVNLTHSPAVDTAPALSPDGKQIAFFSDRGGHYAVYVIGIDGRGLTRVSPDLLSAGGIVWSLDGKRLAVSAGENAAGNTIVSSLHVEPPHRRVIIATVGGGIGRMAWSPDGRLITFSANDLRAYTPAGHLVWHVPGTFSFAWSAKDRIAAEVDGRRMIRGLKYPTRSVHVYDEQGRLLATAPDTQFAWTSDGERLVTIDQRHTLEVRADGGTRLVLRRREALSGQILWTGKTRLIGDGFTLSLVTGAEKPAAISTWPGPVSPDGREVVTAPENGRHFALGVVGIDGTHARMLVRDPGCANRNSYDPTIENVEFTPDSRSLIYDTYCPQPYSNLYRVSPGGGKVRRLTSDAAVEVDPRLSPDGSRIAYSRGLVPDGNQPAIWIANDDGSHAHQVTDSHDCGETSPSWSPDGKQVVYGIENCDNPEFRLGVVSASGRDWRVIPVSGESPVWGPDGIAYDDANGGLWIVELDGKRAHPLPNVGRPFAWSPDGRLAYVKRVGAKASIAIVSNGHPRVRIQLRLRGVTSLGWSPDGRSFVLVGGPGRDVYTVGTDGKHLKRLTLDIGASTASWR